MARGERRGAESLINSPKCAYCSSPIGTGDLVIFAHGDLIHELCWRILLSRDRVLESRRLINRGRARRKRPIHPPESN